MGIRRLKIMSFVSFFVECTMNITLRVWNAARQVEMR